MNMSISLTELSVITIIGVYPEERVTPQELLFDIDIEFNAQKAIASDDIEHTIDYYQLSEDIAAFVQGTSYQLLERLIHDIADLIMSNPRSNRCRVKATKPEIISKAKSISLCIEKQRQNT